MRNNILFVAPFQLPIRNFLFTGLARQCRINLNADVSFATPYNLNELRDEEGEVFKNYYLPCTLDPSHFVGPIGISKILRLASGIKLDMFAVEYPNGSWDLHCRASRRNIEGAISKVLTIMFPKSSKLRSLARLLIDKINPVYEPASKIIDEVKPKLVVVPSNGFNRLDLVFLIEAKRRKIPTVSIVVSWDNLYSRGPMIRRPDLLLVWSEVMRQQAINIHKYPGERIEVIGALQFSQYAKHLTEEEIYSELSKLGISSHEEYFFYVPGGSTWEYDCEDVANMIQVLKHSEFKNVKIIVRPHPQSPPNVYASLRGLPIIFDKAHQMYRPDVNPFSFDANEIHHMACLLSKAKVVISSCGTTALLEAAIFDRPILQLRWMDAFLRKNKSQTERVRMMQRCMHLVDFDKCNCRAFSYTPGGIVQDINVLLSNNEEYKRDRKRAVETLVELPLESCIPRVLSCLERYL